jgi:hypothetical protein
MHLSTLINVQKQLICPGIPADGWEALFASDCDSAYNYQSLSGIIPTVTRIAVFDIAQRLKTFPGGRRTQYQIYDRVTSNEVGNFTIGSDQESEIPSQGTFIQLFLTNQDPAVDKCHIMLIKASEVKLSMSKTDRAKVAEKFRPMDFDRYNYRNDPSLPSRIHLPDFYIDEECKRVAMEKKVVTLASRFGIGTIELEAWRDAKPEPALVILG